MGAIENRLAELGLELPAPPAPPPGVRLPFELVRIHGDVAYVSGHGPFDGDRLQSETPSRAPDQNVDAGSETHANLPRGTDVFASKGSRWRAGGGREHGPAQFAACRNADIDTYGIKCALIELYRERRVLNETALHGLMAEDDEPNAWVELACQLPTCVHVLGAWAIAA